MTKLQENALSGLKNLGWKWTDIRPHGKKIQLVASARLLTGRVVEKLVAEVDGMGRPRFYPE